MLKKHQNAICRLLAVLALIGFQIFLMVLLPHWLRANTLYIYYIIEICSVMMLMPLIADETNSAYKIFWVAVVLLLPITGHIMYELWGKGGNHNKQHRIIQKTIEYYKQIGISHKNHEDIISGMDASNRKISKYLYNNGYPPYKNTEMIYFSEGKDKFEAMLKDLKNAERFIFLSFFTIADGYLLDTVREILIERAKHGVEIRIMYDDAGSIFQLTADSIRRLKEANIQVKKFNSIEKNLHRQHFQYRNHQKIIVIDGNISYTGGLNISDRHININSPYKHWKDVAIRIYGEGTYEMTLIFLGMWNNKKAVDGTEPYKPTVSVKSEEICQPYADGPASNPDKPARDMYHLLANMAEKELLIMTPYLILDDETRDCLHLAAKSGVEVKIITPGTVDRRSVKLLSEWNYGTLLKAGIKIYEYQLGFVHAKTCINDTSGMLGTVNMDFRSFYLHYECGVWFGNSKMREEIRKDFYETLKNCREITLEEWERRPFSVRMRQMLLQNFRSQF